MGTIMYGPGYSYYPESYDAVRAGVGAGAIIFGIIALLYIAIFAIAILDYIFASIGLYKIAKRRGLSNPWLAWIPLANCWIIGGIAEEYDGKRGIWRKWKRALLTAMLVTVCSAVLMVIMAVVMAVMIVAVKAEAVIFPMILVILLYITLIVAALAYSICTYICLFKIFESTYTEKALKYMILSLLLPLAHGICLFRCRNKGYSNMVQNDNYAQVNYIPPQE